MTVPYERIKSRIDCRNVPCVMCDRVTVQQVIDRCHAHGWARGVVCVSCNNRMARVDADLTLATPNEMFHRDNCPACRRDGQAGVTRRVTLQARAARATRRGVTTCAANAGTPFRCETPLPASATPEPPGMSRVRWGVLAAPVYRELTARDGRPPSAPKLMGELVPVASRPRRARPGHASFARPPRTISGYLRMPDEGH